MSGARVGYWTCLSLVIGNIIGAGVFFLPAALAPFGSNAVIGWGVTIAGATLLAYLIARLASAIEGGPYAYAERAFGGTAAFLILWSYWVSCWAAMAALAIAGVGALEFLIPALGRTPGVAPMIGVGMLWLFTLVNGRGVRAVGSVQVVTAALKIVPMVAVALLAAGLIVTGWDVPGRLAPVPVTSAGIAGAASLALFAMMGFEVATLPDGKVADARRVVPRATVTGALVAGCLYLLACSAVLILLPADRAAVSTAPFADAVSPVLGTAAGRVIAGFMVVSVMGALNGWVLCAGEVLSTLARRGGLPAWVSAVNARSAPLTAQFVSTAAATLLVLCNGSRSLGGLFAFVVLVSTVASLVLYAACAGAVWWLLPGRGLRVAAIIGLGYALTAIWGAGAEAIGWGLALLATGLPVWWWGRCSQRRMA